MMIEHKIQSIDSLIQRLNRSTSKNHYKYLKIYRTALEYKIQLYDQNPIEIIFLKQKTFRKKIKKIELNFKPEDL